MIVRQIRKRRPPAKAETAFGTPAGQLLGTAGNADGNHRGLNLFNDIGKRQRCLGGSGSRRQLRHRGRQRRGARDELIEANNQLKQEIAERENK